MTEILEAIMVICFGISWPLSIRKSFYARTNKGKSLLFLIFITTGYVCGIASKIIGDNITYVFFFYVLNLCMLIVELILYARNGVLDKINDRKEAKEAKKAEKKEEQKKEIQKAEQVDALIKNGDIKEQEK